MTKKNRTPKLPSKAHLKAVYHCDGNPAIAVECAPNPMAMLMALQPATQGSRTDASSF